VDMQKDIHDKGDPNKIISHGENYNQQGGPTASVKARICWKHGAGMTGPAA